MAKSNLVISNHDAHSYNTCIAVFNFVAWIPSKFAILNVTKYSPTTSKHQNKVRAKLESEGYTIFTVRCGLGATHCEILESSVPWGIWQKLEELQRREYQETVVFCNEHQQEVIRQIQASGFKVEVQPNPNYLKISF